MHPYPPRLRSRQDYGDPGNVSYTAEFSADLTEWTKVTGPITIEHDDGDYELVSIPYPALLPPSGQKARFFRVAATLLP